MNKKAAVYARIDGTRCRITCEDVGENLEDLACGCPHCGSDRVKVVVDVLQLGMFEDRGLLVKKCKDCLKGYAFRYTMKINSDNEATYHDQQQHE